MKLINSSKLGKWKSRHFNPGAEPVAPPPPHLSSLDGRDRVESMRIYPKGSAFNQRALCLFSFVLVWFGFPTNKSAASCSRNWPVLHGEAQPSCSALLLGGFLFSFLLPHHHPHTTYRPQKDRERKIPFLWPGRLDSGINPTLAPRQQKYGMITGYFCQWILISPYLSFTISGRLLQSPPLSRGWVS